MSAGSRATLRHGRLNLGVVFRSDPGPLGGGLGTLTGIERERRHKEAGVRTFTFGALLGAVGGLLGDADALLAVALLGVYC